jgi:hypothetical protein
MQRSARGVVLAGATALGIATLAVPAVAGAAVNNPPALPHTIISFPQRDFVSADGFEAGNTVTVNVIRNGNIIATSEPVTPQDDPTTPAFDGLVEVNHPGGGCWVTTTPDILPGDIVQTTQAVTGVQDATPTANVTADRPINPAPGTIVVHGTAQTAAGTRIPLAQVEQRLVANQDAFDANGRRTLRAGNGGEGTFTYDAGGGVAFTATYTGLDAADITRALGAESRALWLGRNPGTGQELTIYENPGTPGPAAPCTAPLASTAIGGVTPAFINIANGAADVIVSGPATADITNVHVTVPGFAVDAIPSGGTWSAPIPQSAIGQGSTVVTAAFTGPTAPPNQTRTIVKDTVAPGTPTATPAPGTYTTAQSVTISGEAGSSIHYTNDGSAPTAASPTASGAIPVTSSQTLRAIAVDAAGNPGAEGAFGYTISAAAAGGAGAGAGTQAGAIAGAPATPAATGTDTAAPTARPKLTLKQIGLAPVVRRSKAQKKGIRLSLRLPSGTEIIKVNVYRKTSKGLKLLSSGYKVAPSSTGVSHVAQSQPALRRLLVRGSYQVQVTPGYSKSELGTTAKASFKVV